MNSPVNELPVCSVWKKICWPSYKMANAAAKKTHGTHLHAYHCDDCGKWHVGHYKRYNSYRSSKKDTTQNQSVYHPKQALGEGWGWAFASMKRHYWKDGAPACGAASEYRPNHYYPVDTQPHTLDCVDCARLIRS